MELTKSYQDTTNGATWSVSKLINVWTIFIDQYGLPVGQYCIGLVYALYRHCTLLNVAILLLKYVPTGIYMYKLLKSIYVSSRERIMDKKMQLDDIQLQIQIVNTKLCVRNAEFMERTKLLRRCAERLRAVRARVRDVIAADEALRRALDSGGPWGDDPDLHMHATPEDEREFLITLLKQLKADQVAIPERQTDKTDCGEHAPSDLSASENSVYSTLSDSDTKQDCRVKIVKVTNVYRVAYLKHFIKQKRLRRANNQAVLKKKIEDIKKLLEDWQRSLNMVINSKLSMLNTNALDMASQEAMGDYSKPTVRESSDCDSDMRAGGAESFFDEYGLAEHETQLRSWTQNPYTSYGYSYDDIPESAVAKEITDCQDFDEVKMAPAHACECSRSRGSNALYMLPEETSSQVNLEARRSDGDYEAECRDMLAL